MKKFSRCINELMRNSARMPVRFLLMLTGVFIFGLSFAETEPANNNPSGADSILIGISVTANTQPGDYDYFKLETAEDADAITATVTCGSGTYIYLYLYDSKMNDLGSNSNYAGAAISKGGLAAGTYYILVYNGSPASSYSLSASLTSTTQPNDIEPNDDFAAALPIAENDSAKGHISFRNDDATVNMYDYYRLNTSEDGQITASVTVDNGHYVYLYLYDSLGFYLMSNSNYGTASFSRDGLEEGTYFLMIYTDGNNYGCYTLRNSTAYPPIANDNEPNDDFATALPLAENASASGHISYRFDVGGSNNDDYYEMYLSQDGRIDASVTNEFSSSSHYIYLYLYDAAGNLLHSAGNYSATGLSHDGLAAGTYFLRVASDINNYGSYTLTNTSATPAEVNDAEPNNNLETAVPLAENGSTQGHIGYRYDAGGCDAYDYYKMHTSSDGSITASVVNQNSWSSHYISIYLYDAVGNQLIGAGNYNSTSFFKDGLASGTYFILVTTDINNYGGYILTNTTSTPAEINDVEPNDNFITALSIAENGSAQGHIGYRNDDATYNTSDYYRLETSDDGLIDASVVNDNSASTHYVSVYLYDSTGTVLASGSGYNATSLSKNGLGFGTYFLQVYSDGNNYGGYVLSNTITPTAYANDPEPNNEFAHSSFMLSTDTVTGHIGHRSDVGIIDSYDYWQLTNCIPGDINLSVVNTNNNYIYLYLYDQSFNYLISGSNYGSVNIGKATQPAGTYYAVVYADGNNYSGYELVSNLTGAIPPLTISSIEIEKAICGLANGAIDITVNGGTAPYYYNWSTGDTTEDIANLSGGKYDVTVTDANECAISKSISVSHSTEVLLSETHTDNLCFGENAGTIDLSANGGTPPYNYNWSNGETTEDISGLIAATYAITVTDQDGCSATASVPISQPSLISISQIVTSPLCNGSFNGSIDLTVSGGTPAYNFLWSTGELTEDLASIGAGYYAVTVTDNNGCTCERTVNVTEPNLISLIESHVDVSVQGGNDGSINLTATGGTPPFTYEWSNGATTQDISDLYAGNYSVVVTDTHGCTEELGTTINEPAGCSISVTATHADVSCTGQSDGTISVEVSGATEPITYAWSDGGTNTPDRNGMPAGDYNVVVTDANSCTGYIEISIGEIALPGVTISNHNSGTECEQGTISVSLSAGVPPYTVQLYQDGTVYGEPVVTEGDYTFTKLGNGEYFATAYSSGSSVACAMASESVVIMPVSQDLTVVSATSTKAKLTWTSLPCMEEYQVYLRSAANPDKVLRHIVDGNTSTVFLGGLTPDTKYQVAIRSVDLTNWKNVSNLSPLIKFKTLPARLGNEDTATAFSIYPNPATSVIHVSFENDMDAKAVFRILDLAGKVMLSKDVNLASGMASEEIDIQSLAEGVYQLQVIIGGEMVLNHAVVKVTE